MNERIWYNAAMNFKSSFKYLALIVSIVLGARAAQKKPVDLTLAEVEKKYSQAQLVSMDVTKQMTLSVLKKQKISKGKLNFGPKGYFRLELNSPFKSLIVMNGQDIWVVEYPEGEANIQVLHSKYKEQLKAQFILNFLMGKNHLQKHFKIESKTEKADKITYKLKPIVEESDLKSMQLVILPESSTITQVSYTDTLSNEIKFDFKNEQIKETLDKKLFTFKPPKDAEVSEI